MRINKNIIAIILLVTIFGSMSLTKAIGVWSDTDGLTKAVEAAEKNIAKETINTNINNDDNTEGNEIVRLEISVSEIKGSSTFQQVSDVYGVLMNDFIKAFSLDESITGEMKIKDLESIWGKEDSKEGEIGTASVRYFVALYVGEEYTTGEEYLPKKAVEILEELNKLNDEAKLYLDTHTVNK